MDQYVHKNPTKGSSLMTDSKFNALVVHETETGTFERRLEQRAIRDLPEGETLIRVRFSSLNYKDVLSATGNKGITRAYPHTPGIDAAGEIVETSTSGLNPGDPVVVTGYDLGMNTDGGFGEYIRVPATWIVPKPAGLSLLETMTFGTAGFTAALSIQRLRDHGVQPTSGPILVTGATGGVGSMAVAMLGTLGYTVIAATGTLAQTPFLKNLGADEVIDRDELCGLQNKGLLKARFAGAVDTVGGEILSTAIKSVHWRGSVTCCGLVAGPQLSTSLFPFLLRGINLLGIDSAETPLADKKALWSLMAGEWKPAALKDLTTTCSLNELNGYIDTMLTGGTTGRIVLQHA
jgi:putative YhdH/YhfP family quinone oxidoreductase